jgi:hypothetical protein
MAENAGLSLPMMDQGRNRKILILSIIVACTKKEIEDLLLSFIMRLIVMMEILLIF